jgi:hypothetical protein
LIDAINETIDFSTSAFETVAVEATTANVPVVSACEVDVATFTEYEYEPGVFLTANLQVFCPPKKPALVAGVVSHDEVR